MTNLSRVSSDRLASAAMARTRSRLSELWGSGDYPAFQLAWSRLCKWASQCPPSSKPGVRALLDCLPPSVGVEVESLLYERLWERRGLDFEAIVARRQSAMAAYHHYPPHVASMDGMWNEVEFDLDLDTFDPQSVGDGVGGDD